MMNKLLSEKNTFALVVTYNPETQTLDLLKNLLQQFRKIIVVDNNSKNKLFLIDYCKQENISIIENDYNVGLASALNQGCKLGFTEGFSWVVTFDQDTIILPNLFSILQEVYYSYQSKDLIGAIGTNYYNKNYNISSESIYDEIDYLITSGTLYSLDILFQLGMFRDDLFIDNIDIEYSLRLMSNKKKSLLAKSFGMIHSPGNVVKKKILFISTSSSNHNYQRRYFMSRNHIVIFKLYFKTQPYFILKATYFFLISIFKILLIEKNRLIKLKYTYKGLVDGFKYKIN